MGPSGPHPSRRGVLRAPSRPAEGPEGPIRAPFRAQLLDEKGLNKILTFFPQWRPKLYSNFSFSTHEPRNLRVSHRQNTITRIMTASRLAGQLWAEQWLASWRPSNEQAAGQLAAGVRAGGWAGGRAGGRAAARQTDRWVLCMRGKDGWGGGVESADWQRLCSQFV